MMSEYFERSAEPFVPINEKYSLGIKDLVLELKSYLFSALATSDT